MCTSYNLNLAHPFFCNRVVHIVGASVADQAGNAVLSLLRSKVGLTCPGSRLGALGPELLKSKKRKGEQPYPEITYPIVKELGTSHWTQIKPRGNPSN